MARKPATRSRVHVSNEVFRNRQFSFVTQRITLPNGVDTESAFVRHPGSAVIVPLFEDRTIGVIRQFRHPVNDYLYEIPAGTMHPGENPEACAFRELEEETGYAAEKMTGLGSTFLLPAYSDELSHVYLARGLTKTARKPDHDEIIEVLRFTVQQILAMIDDQTILDALSVLAVFRALRYLEREEGIVWRQI